MLGGGCRVRGDGTVQGAWVQDPCVGLVQGAWGRWKGPGQARLKEGDGGGEGGQTKSVQSCHAGGSVAHPTPPPPRDSSPRCSLLRDRGAPHPLHPALPGGGGDATQGWLHPGFYYTLQDRGFTKRVMVPFLPLFFLPHLPPSFLLSLPFIMHAQEGRGGGLSLIAGLGGASKQPHGGLVLMRSRAHPFPALAPLPNRLFNFCSTISSPPPSPVLPLPGGAAGILLQPQSG